MKKIKKFTKASQSKKVQVKRCPDCGLYTKPVLWVEEPYEECRLCGIVIPIIIGKDMEIKNR